MEMLMLFFIIYITQVNRSNTKLFFKIYTRSEVCPLLRSLQAGSSQYYFCTLTILLVRDKHQGLQSNKLEGNHFNLSYTPIKQKPVSGWGDIVQLVFIYSITVIFIQPQIAFESTTQNFFFKCLKRGVNSEICQKMPKISQWTAKFCRSKCPNFAVNCDISAFESDFTPIWPRLGISEK